MAKYNAEHRIANVIIKLRSQKTVASRLRSEETMAGLGVPLSK